MLEDSARALSLQELGRSSEGRVVWGRRFGAPGPAILVVGGVHGDEPASVEAVVALGGRLLADGGPAAPVWLLPALNPDGLARGSKNSARDVDLNRNFPAGSFRTTHAPGYSPGPSPLSEPETRILAQLVEEHEIQAVVAVHAPFACVNYDGPAEAWASAVAAASGWPARADIGYPTPGSLGSWLGVDRGLPVLTLELPAGPYGGFRAQADAALDEATRARNHARSAE
jgi:murein peptide amidase A